MFFFFLGSSQYVVKNCAQRASSKFVSVDDVKRTLAFWAVRTEIIRSATVRALGGLFGHRTFTVGTIKECHSVIS